MGSPLVVRRWGAYPSGLLVISIPWLADIWYYASCMPFQRRRLWDVCAGQARCRACRWAEARHRFGTFEAVETCITDGVLRLGYSAIGFAHLQALGHA